MWGAIIGDVVGSIYEGAPGGTPRFDPLFGTECTFTDDSVCTAAVASMLLDVSPEAATLKRWCRRHPQRGYGGHFRQWVEGASETGYGSYGNGGGPCASPPPPGSPAKRPSTRRC